MSPFVSIAIPAYKTEYLHEAIASALNQTHQNLELIIVDDCSPNDVSGVVNSFDDSRIRYFRNEQNKGSKDPGVNWNICLQYAKGEYFCLLCDDDIYESTFVEEMLQLALAYPQCNVFRARAKVIDDSGNVVNCYPSSPQWESCRDYIWHVSRKLRKQTISEWMHRTEHIRKCGGYINLPYAWGADYVSIYHFSIRGGIASTNKLLVGFRNSGVNISSMPQKNAKEKLRANYLREQIMYTFAKTHSMEHGIIQDIMHRKICEDVFILKNMAVCDFVQMIIHRKKYNIQKKSFLKAIKEKIFVYLRD